MLTIFPIRSPLQHQPPQSAQTAHQQLVEAPTNSQHQTASGQHQSEFTGK